MTSKEDRAAIAVCTGFLTAACTEHGVKASCKTRMTTGNKAAEYPYTSKVTAKSGSTGIGVHIAITAGLRVENLGVQVMRSGRTVTVLWKK